MTRPVIAPERQQPHPSHKESSTQGDRSSVPTEGHRQHSAGVTLLYPGPLEMGTRGSVPASPVTVLPIDREDWQQLPCDSVPVYRSSEIGAAGCADLRPSACGGKALAQGSGAASTANSSGTFSRAALSH